MHASTCPHAMMHSIARRSIRGVVHPAKAGARPTAIHARHWPLRRVIACRSTRPTRFALSVTPCRRRATGAAAEARGPCTCPLALGL